MFHKCHKKFTCVCACIFSVCYTLRYWNRKLLLGNAEWITKSRKGIYYFCVQQLVCSFLLSSKIHCQIFWHKFYFKKMGLIFLMNSTSLAFVVQEMFLPINTKQLLLLLLALLLKTFFGQFHSIENTCCQSPLPVPPAPCFLIALCSFVPNSVFLYILLEYIYLLFYLNVLYRHLCT